MAVIDQVKSFWDRRPCNIRHSDKPVGTKEYFDEVEARKYFVEPHILGFAQHERWKGKKVLEIGCGIGTDSLRFARAGADITCTDLSESSLDLTKQRFNVYGLRASFYQGNAEELSSFIPVEPYDLIYSFGVIHHTPNPRRVIEQLSHYVHPGTEIRIMLYSKWSWKALWIVATYGKCQVWKARDLVQTYSEAESGSPVTYTYSPKDVVQLLDGYEVTEVRKDHIFPYVIGKYVKYQYQWVWYFRWIPMPFFRWFERKLGWHTLVVAKPRS